MAQVLGFGRGSGGRSKAHAGQSSLPPRGRLRIVEYPEFADQSDADASCRRDCKGFLI